ncbi:MAG TPA: glycoside hydrolase family 3 N-terminal domain-containing protein [Pedococcus sp.]|jgi:beta-N-acetylhexosaminidase|nr:glycoside hydrolase family 3 N-terminal domain-containing protein [Pedococcus sp.]
MTVLGGPAAAPPALATPSALAATPASVAQAVFNRMSEDQRIGQLFMLGAPASGLGSATVADIVGSHVGNLILTGRATSGAASVRAVTAGADALTSGAATGGVPLLIASDQEGGYVQVLQGPGFSWMPTALVQGTLSDAVLTADAATWGRQVRSAGLDVNLAPVMDTVSQAFARQNAPIGYYQREFGYTPTVVADKGSAFLRGMRSSGLAMTAKHFPGLGRVAGNTDTTVHVVDSVTTRTSPDLVPFKAAIASGASLMMVSSAYYSRIDASRPAVFSPTVITGMIRGDLHFSGVVVSDDLGNAAAVQPWSPGARAVGFLLSGGDLVLSVNPVVVPAMVSAVRARVATDPAFAARVAASVLRVLTLKAAMGLLAPRLVADGIIGPATATALQRWLGVPTSGWLDPTTIRALQWRIGTTADGVWGPMSMGALQSFLGTYRDGARTWNARTVVVLQRYLTTQL